VTKRFKVSEHLAKVYNIRDLEKKQNGALITKLNEFASQIDFEM
jgi:hypothetical protein